MNELHAFLGVDLLTVRELMKGRVVAENRDREAAAQLVVRLRGLGAQAMVIKDRVAG